MPNTTKKLLIQNFVQHPALKVNSICREYVDSDAIGQLLITYSVSVKYLRKKWEHNEAVRQLFIDFKKAYDSVRREALYNILIEFGIPKKLVRLIKM